MKPRAGQNQIRSPCPRALRAPARPHVRLSDTARTGRAAEDGGPYHPSCPERARRAKDPRRPRRGTSPSGRVAIHCDRSRKASCRSTRSTRRHEGTEEVESWFTRTSVMDCLIPRPGMARSLSDAPRRGGANPSRTGLSSGGDFTLRTVSERGAGMVKKRE